MKVTRFTSQQGRVWCLGILCLTLVALSPGAMAAPEVLLQALPLNVAGQEADTAAFTLPAGINRTVIISVHARTDAGTADHVTVEWVRIDGNAALEFTTARARSRNFIVNGWQSTTMLYRHIPNTLAGDVSLRVRMADNLTENKVVYVWVLGNMDPAFNPTPADANGDDAEGIGNQPRIDNFFAAADFVVVDSATHNSNATLTGRSPGGATPWAQTDIATPTYKAVTRAFVKTASDSTNFTWTIGASRDWTMVAVRFRAAYVIEATAGPNGVINPSGDVAVPSGNDQAFDISANNNFVIAQLLVDGEPVPGAAGIMNFSYLFSNVTENHTISATFSGRPEILNMIPAETIECDAVGYTLEMALQEVSADDLEDGSLTAEIVVSGVTFPILEPGVHTILYDVTDSDGTPAEQEQRIVTIVDTIPPEIVAGQISPMMVECGIDTFEHLAYAVDQCDGVFDVVIGGDDVDGMVLDTYVVTYNALDNAGLAADEVQLVVHVVDNTPPMITLLAENNPLILDGGAFYIEAGATAWDACEGDIPPEEILIENDSVNTGSIGTYSVTYTVEDSIGNVGVEVLTVIVQREDCALVVNAPTTVVTALPGDQVTLEVELGQESCAVGAIKYEWLKRNENKEDGFSVIPGSPNAPSLVISSATEADSGVYRCDVSDDMYTVSSPEITLTVGTGLPVAGLAGLAIAAAVAAMAGAVALRKRAN